MKLKPLIILFGLLISSCATSNQIKHYSGEGEIHQTPTPFFVRDGYTLVFPRLKIGQGVNESYHLNGLPNVGSPIKVYFVIEDPRPAIERRRSELTSIFAISLKDERGNMVFHVKQKLSDFIWGYANEKSMLYDKDLKMTFVANPQKEYVLTIEMESEPLLKDFVGYAMIECGLWGK